MLSCTADFNEESEGEWEGKSFYCARCAAKYAVQGHKEDYHEESPGLMGECTSLPWCLEFTTGSSLNQGVVYTVCPTKIMDINGGTNQQLLVGGLEHVLFFHNYIGNNHPN